MDINELINKQIWVNYKKLTEIFGLPYLNGSKKISQIDELNQNYIIERRKSKFLIVREKTQQEKEESREYKTYNMLLETCFYNYLSQCEGYEVILTIPKLIQTLKLVNENYYYGKYNQDEVYEIMSDLDLDIESNINTFYINTESNFKAKIKKMLDNMEEKSLISYSKHLCLSFINGKYTTTRRATAQEIVEFLRIQQLLLEKYKHENGEYKLKSELNKSENFSFYKSLEREMKKTFGCDHYSYEYYIILNKVGISERMVSNINILSSAINDKVQINLLNRYDELLIDWFISSDTTFNLREEIKKNRLKQLE